MKLLVLASDPVGADDVRRALPGDDDISGAEVLVVAPAVNESPMRFWMSDADAAIARYREDDVVGEAERRFGVPVTEVTR